MQYEVKFKLTMFVSWRKQSPQCSIKSAKRQCWAEGNHWAANRKHRIKKSDLTLPLQFTVQPTQRPCRKQEHSSQGEEVVGKSKCQDVPSDKPLKQTDTHSVGLFTWYVVGNIDYSWFINQCWKSWYTSLDKRLFFRLPNSFNSFTFTPKHFTHFYVKSEK